ncbi:hypothetical protein [Thalassotalea castellviae]|uniref:Uncharacterized protein n=1 Tax=Thalassotalea castellviae TaxID=3075612 RepID=A0ABU2ZX71_9GAMM|nr:hypothetical protein [Thalassotalea sp. W431]MDT0602529.1 hypothetical protein [Thalassotalea sp. W431]
MKLTVINHYQFLSTGNIEDVIKNKINEQLDGMTINEVTPVC